MNSTAQVIFKKGASMINYNQPLGSLCLSIIANIYVCSGVFVLIMGLILWIYLISQFDVGFLYPITSLGFVITSIAGWAFLGEIITWHRVVGISFILVGVMFVAKS
ncbi:MAG: EamA family transporter [Holosporaceae bacterium]|jgi:drug/metabolite transporter (DMT)-like permease|nr:EamA family transporter [Holosporaceae bacterium]